MSDLEVLVEERSMKAFLEVVLPVVEPGLQDFEVHAFNGKSDLLRKLPQRLLGYTYYNPRPQVLVVVDRDDDDCRALKQVMESAASGAKLDTRATVSPGAAYDVCNRIAVEELEAWILGDESAVRSAFPKVGTFAGKSRFRHPDEVTGGTWEALERLLQSAGYYAGGLPKVDCAAKVAPHIDPTRTRSRSFATFVAGVRALVAVGNASETRGGGEA